MQIHIKERKIFLVFLLVHCHAYYATASRFSINGPTLTVTLKDPGIPKKQSKQGYASFYHKEALEDASQEKDYNDASEANNVMNKIIGISGLNPSVTWGIQSLGKPFPKRIPFFKSMSMRSKLSYDNNDNDNFVEGQMTFGTSFEEKSDLTVSLNPSYQLKEKKTNLLVAIGSNGGRPEDLKSSAGGGFFGLLRFTSKGRTLLEYIRASYKTSLPFATVNSITITPAFDFSALSPTCILEGESGTGRTSAKLDLNWDSDSTLTVIHALDSYNTIAPEISLTTAKIMYHWDVALSPTGSNIRTKVDPTSSIQVVWTDVTDGGKWVTDFTLPLDGNNKMSSGRGVFAADIHVRRQFKF